MHSHSAHHIIRSTYFVAVRNTRKITTITAITTEKMKVKDFAKNYIKKQNNIFLIKQLNRKRK